MECCPSFCEETVGSFACGLCVLPCYAAVCCTACLLGMLKLKLLMSFFLILGIIFICVGTIVCLPQVAVLIVGIIFASIGSIGLLYSACASCFPLPAIEKQSLN